MKLLSARFGLTVQDRLGEHDAPAKLSFSGHQTFPFRYAWLPKGIRHLTTSPGVFFQDDAVVALGVGKNMVESIRFWCQALGLATFDGRRKLGSPTALGRAIFDEGGWDPYLEDPATLWLLHWQLVDFPEIASTWSLVFTRWSRDVFTRDDLVSWLKRWAEHSGGTRASSVSLKRDVDVFLRTYVPSTVDRRRSFEDTFDCPLVELGLIRELDDGFFQFSRIPKSGLPLEIFMYAVSMFWNRHASGQETLGIERLLYDAGSPGAAFKLSETDLAQLLEAIPSSTGFRYDETAGLRVLMRAGRSPRRPVEFLERYYEKSSGGKR